MISWMPSPVLGFWGWLMQARMSVLLALAAVSIIAVAFTWKLVITDHHRKAAERSVDRLTDELGVCTGNLAQATQDIAQRDALIEGQNRAVAALKAESDARTQRANAAIAAARQQARTYKARAERIAAARPSGDVCTSARSLIVETLSEDRR